MENSPGRGPRGQVFVRGVESKRSAALGWQANKDLRPIGALRNALVHKEHSKNSLSS